MKEIFTKPNNDKRSISNNTFSSLTVTDETTSYKTDIRSFETHTANRSLYLPDSTGTLATHEWISSNGYRKIGGVPTSVTYTSTVGYQDINVSSLTGQNVIGVLGMAGLGNRQRPVYSITNGSQTAFTVSVAFAGLATASSVQLHIYYMFV